MNSSYVLSGIRVARSLVFCVFFIDYCLSFCFVFFWPLYWLSFDLRLLITSLVSSKFSSINMLQHSAAHAYGIYITIRSFTYSRLITGFVTKVPRRVSLVGQVLFMLFVYIYEYYRPTRFSYHKMVLSFNSKLHDGCNWRDRHCLSLRSTWVHFRF